MGGFRHIVIAGLTVLAACANNSANAASDGGMSGAASTAHSAPVQAPAGPASLPAAVTAYAEDFRRQCAARGGPFGIQMFRRGTADYDAALDFDHDGRIIYYETADFNGDGQVDYILLPRFQCHTSDGSGMFVIARCGVQFDFVISSPRGYRRIDNPICGRDDEAHIEGREGRDVLMFGSRETGFGVWGWNGRTLDFLYALTPDGTRTDGEGRPIDAAGRVIVAAPVGPLGIAPGYYVDENVACAEATTPFFYDGARIGQRDMESRWIINPVGRVTRQRDGQLLVADHAMLLRRLPQGRIQLEIQDTGSPMRLCPRNQLPAALRR